MMREIGMIFGDILFIFGDFFWEGIVSYLGFGVDLGSFVYYFTNKYKLI